MAIKYIQVGQAGVSNRTPSWVYIETNDTHATVTTTGYLSGAAAEYEGSFQNNMMALVSTKTSQSIGVQPVLYTLQLSGSNGVWSLVAPAEDVPVPFIVPGDIQAGMNGVAGRFISYPATLNKGNLIFAAVANFGNTSTTVSNAAMGQASVISIPDPGSNTANFILSNIASGPQQITNGSLQLVNGTFIGGDPTGSILQAALLLYPRTASKGSLQIEATANTGNTQIMVTNAAFGQASTLTIPDPGGAAANFVLDHGTTTLATGASIVAHKVNGAESSNAVTASGMAGVITTSSLSTAGAASYAITWTNTFISTTSVVFLTISGGTNTTENITFTVVPGSGSATLTIYNNTAATALNGTIFISYLVM